VIKKSLILFIIYWIVIKMDTKQLDFIYKIIGLVIILEGLIMFYEVWSKGYTIRAGFIALLLIYAKISQIHTIQLKNSL